MSQYMDGFAFCSGPKSIGEEQESRQGGEVNQRLAADKTPEPTAPDTARSRSVIVLMVSICPVPGGNRRRGRRRAAHARFCRCRPRCCRPRSRRSR